MKETRENKKNNESLKNLNSQRAITLIALVVTIVVLLILAGISISLVLGENGIINKAKESGVLARAGSVEDEVTLWKADQYLAENTNDTAETENEMLARLVANKLITADDEVDEENKIIIVKDKNGTVVKEISYAYTTDKVTENIFEYTAEGYITGIKDEYLTDSDPSESNPRVSNAKELVKIANINNNSIKLASMRLMYLVEELNEEITIPKEINGTKIVGIDTSAFYGIFNLKRVTINAEIDTIKERAFAYCDNLNEITIPSTVVNMGTKVFYACSDITINVPFKEGEQPETWDADWNLKASEDDIMTINYAK